MLEGTTARRFRRDLLDRVRQDSILNGAAALGYYLTLAIFPAMILLMSIIPYLPIDRVDEAIMNMLGQVLPAQSVTLVHGVVVDVTTVRHAGLVSFGALSTVWVTSTAMHAVMRQLDTLHDVAEARSFARARATALALCLALCLLAVAAFSLIAAARVTLSGVGDVIGSDQMPNVALGMFRWAVIVLALMLGFAVIYRYAPSVRTPFAVVTWGSVVGVTLLVLSSLAFLHYVRNFGHYHALYGGIGAFIMLMLWMYICGLAILVGSEINAVVEAYRTNGPPDGDPESAARNQDRTRLTARVRG